MSSARTQRGDENGFTLIELIVVVAIMPIIVGAMVAALLSIISFTPSIENRLSDSADAQVVTTNFNKDVQGATMLTTYASATNPSACGPGTQLLGIQYANGTEISYSLVTQGSGPTAVNNLYRNEGQISAGVCALSSSTLVSHDVVAQTGTGTPSASLTCSTATAPSCAGTPPAYQAGWVSVSQVQNVSLPFMYVASSYKQTLYAVPSGGINANGGGVVANAPYSCGFATANTGTYAQTLCFLDFTAWNTHNGTTACGNGGQQITDGIANTPFTISFCLSTTGGPIVAAAIPTYTNPPTSEAFLGNTNPITNQAFYTGIPGNPALYQNVEGTTSTITITNIQVVGTGGVPATNWNLVTGDAESTDAGESITWTVGWSPGTTVPANQQGFSLIDNSISPPSAIGNACADPNAGSGLGLGNGLTGVTNSGVGSATVECQASVSSDKTGTVMLSAPAPNSLTANLVGTGLEAIFMGILLPSS
jgi:prepilin-type N-terminal cleavage/methylation domain-containing protein